MRAGKVSEERLQDEINALKAEIRDVRRETASEIKEVRREALEKERTLYKTGIMALGAVVVALGGWAWAEVSHMVKLTVGK